MIRVFLRDFIVIRVTWVISVAMVNRVIRVVSDVKINTIIGFISMLQGLLWLLGLLWRQSEISTSHYASCDFSPSM